MTEGRVLSGGSSAVVSRQGGGIDVERFDADGFTVLPGLLSPDEVAALRGICSRRLTDRGRQEMLPQEFLSVPELTRVPFGADVAAALRAILGEQVVVYPNVTVRKDLYVGWHVDEAFVGAGRESVWEPDFSHVQGAVYLQDNDDRTGGGLDVVPGSHVRSLDERGTVGGDFGGAMADLRRELGECRIPSRAGDLVLWHARLVHASTPSVEGPSSSREDAKFGVFFSAAPKDDFQQNRFLSHLVSKQVQREDGRPVLYPRHAAVLDLRWPDSFPPRVQGEVSAAGVSVASLWR